VDLRWLTGAVLLWGLAACSPTPQLPPVPTLTPSPPLDTPWGAVSVLAEAPVFHPPALISDKTGFIAAAFVPSETAWRLKLYRDDQPIETDITARNPYSLSLYATSNDGIFAVWLDYDGGQLYVAHLTRDGDSALGGVLVTDAPAVRVSAAATADGGLWLVWSTAPIPESVLMVSRIDGLGRPRTPARLTHNADFPAVLRADGRTWLYWLTATDGALYRAELTEAQTLSEPSRLTDGIALETGDVFNGLSVGTDTTSAYVFWQVVQRDSQSQVWWTAGGLTTPSWESPRRLSLTFDSTRPPVPAGFNVGDTQSAQLGGDLPIQWLLPAVGQSDTLPTAAGWGNSVGVLYWRDGAPFSSQTVEDAQHLIAPPAVAYDAERDLALAWWNVLTDQAAGLSIVYSRR